MSERERKHSDAERFLWMISRAGRAPLTILRIEADGGMRWILGFRSCSSDRSWTRPGPAICKTWFMVRLSDLRSRPERSLQIRLPLSIFPLAAVIYDCKPFSPRIVLCRGVQRENVFKIRTVPASSCRLSRRHPKKKRALNSIKHIRAGSMRLTWINKRMFSINFNMKWIYGAHWKCSTLRELRCDSLNWVEEEVENWTLCPVNHLEKLLWARRGWLCRKLNFPSHPLMTLFHHLSHHLKVFFRSCSPSQPHPIVERRRKKKSQFPYRCTNEITFRKQFFSYFGASLLPFFLVVASRILKSLLLLHSNRFHRAITAGKGFFRFVIENMWREGEPLEVQ